MAKNFIREVQTTTDLKAVSEKYFEGMPADKATVEGDLDKRTWADVLSCRQKFTTNAEQRTGTYCIQPQLLFDAARH